MKKVLTGSQVFGIPTDNSDIDIVLLDEDAENLKEYLISDLKIEITMIDNQWEYGEGFYFSIGELTFNIIYAVDMKELTLWKKVTRKMKKRPGIKNKEKRKEAFQDLMSQMMKFPN